MRSPNRLKASTTTVMATPGMVGIHQACHTRSCEYPSICPRLGVGGWMPRPRKLSAASNTITTGRCRVASTSTVGRTFGSTCCARIRTSEAPTARAAAANSRSRKDRTSARTTRA